LHLPTFNFSKPADKAAAIELIEARSVAVAAAPPVPPSGRKTKTTTRIPGSVVDAAAAFTKLVRDGYATSQWKSGTAEGRRAECGYSLRPLSAAEAEHVFECQMAGYFLARSTDAELMRIVAGVDLHAPYMYQAQIVKELLRPIRAVQSDSANLTLTDHLFNMKKKSAVQDVLGYIGGGLDGDLCSVLASKLASNKDPLEETAARRVAVSIVDRLKAGREAYETGLHDAVPGAIVSNRARRVELYESLAADAGDLLDRMHVCM
jgi:hypothetical protein